VKRIDSFTSALLRLQEFLHEEFPVLTSRMIAEISRYVETHFAFCKKT
jgi:hypothetical protein